VGGPVTFGKLYNPNRTKTFFFYNMEWRKYINGGLTNQTVPDPASYGGNFSSNTAVINVPSVAQVAPSVLFGKPTDTTGCKGVVPAGVVQGSPFPGNIIPACMISPNATALLTAGIFPKANAVDSNGRPTFIGGNNSPTNLKEEIVRIDHNFSSKFSVFGHYIAEQVSQGFGIQSVEQRQRSYRRRHLSAIRHIARRYPYPYDQSNADQRGCLQLAGNRISIIPFCGFRFG
jgi:hypothetical protein